MMFGPPVGVFGVGHPKKSLPDMRRTLARSAQIGGPDRIAHSFQVSAYSGEPFTSSRARNLLAKADCRAAVADKVSEERPQVSLIICSQSFSSAAKRLARATAGPDRFIVRPSGEAQGGGPSANPGKEMALRESCKVFWFDIEYAPFVNYTIRNKASGNKLPQPCGH
ncbi:MAG TPA: hypothetical protein VMQ76_01655 [Terracidiphilus sp.]|nr:hypothetical protein [Terracidiphilus sp.]